MRELNLSNDWKLHEGSLAHSPADSFQVLNEESGWLDCELPCDAHMPLARCVSIL